GEGGDVGVVVGEVGAVVFEDFDDFQGGGFADVTDAGFVGDAEDEDVGVFDGFAGVVQGAFDPLDAVVGHALVDFPGEFDELGGHVKFSGAPGQIERVDGEAVSAHPGAGLEGHEAVGFGGGGVDDFPDVDAHPVTQDRELVDQGDVDRAKDVLQQFGQLGRFGGGDGHEVIAYLPVELHRPRHALLGHSPDHLRGRFQGVVGAARI